MNINNKTIIIRKIIMAVSMIVFVVCIVILTIEFVQMKKEREPVLPDGTKYYATEGLLDNDVTVEIRGIEFTGEAGIENGVFKKIYNDIMLLSENMVCNIERITVIDEPIADRIDKIAEREGGERVTAVSNGKEIFINDKKYEEYVLIHEAMHCVDYAYSTDGVRLSRGEEWVSFYEANTHDHTYCWYLRNENSSEYFASVAQIWYMNPEYAAEKFPAEAVFLEENFGELFTDRIKYELTRID